MSWRRRAAEAQLRRTFSEQLRDSTAKAWDLLWKSLRERRLAGQSGSVRCSFLRDGQPRSPLASGGDAVRREVALPFSSQPPLCWAARRVCATVAVDE